MTLSDCVDHKPHDALGGYTCHLLQLGTQRQLSPRKSPRNQAEAQPMYVLMNRRLHRGLRQQPGPLILTGPLEASQDMVVFRENSIQKADLSSSQEFVGTQNQEWAGKFGGLIYIYMNSWLLHTVSYTALATRDNLSPHSHRSPSHLWFCLSLQYIYRVIFLAFPTLHHIFVLCSVVQHLAASSGAPHREFKVYCVVFTPSYSGKIVWDNFCILSIIF